MTPVPPKFFEDISQTKFDPIRYHKWFRVYERRQPLVKKIQSYALAIKYRSMTRIDAHRQTKLDIKYFTFCKHWQNGKSFIDSHPKQKAYWHALNHAYRVYDENKGDYSFKRILEKSAKAYNLSKITMYRLWEFDPKFVPQTT